MLKIIQVKTEVTKCTKHKMCATAKTFGHEFKISVCAGPANQKLSWTEKLVLDGG